MPDTPKTWADVAYRFAELAVFFSPLVYMWWRQQLKIDENTKITKAAVTVGTVAAKASVEQLAVAQQQQGVQSSPQIREMTAKLNQIAAESEDGHK